MRVAITNVQVPFIAGGGEALAVGLRQAFLAHGHDADIITLPFRYAPTSSIHGSMREWESLSLENWTGYAVDLVVPLRFPAWLAFHPRTHPWVLHQHRAVYDLWETSMTGDDVANQFQQERLRTAIHHADTLAFSRCMRVHTISSTIANRLKKFSGVSAETLYHPPPDATDFYTESARPYIYFPSRFESLKRQRLVIEAMAKVRSPVQLVLSGNGGQLPQAQALVNRLGLADRVKLLGRVSDAERIGLYAHAMAVAFTPLDEDLGYVTLEAMLAQKPVITCTDSGGPTEFVIDDITGSICAPEAHAIAEAIDALFTDQDRARRMGIAGRERYDSLGMSWENVVDTLIAA